MISHSCWKKDAFLETLFYNGIIPNKYKLFSISSTSLENRVQNGNSE
jgi:hypothetical protein